MCDNAFEIMANLSGNVKFKVSDVFYDKNAFKIAENIAMSHSKLWTSYLAASPLKSATIYTATSHSKF